MKIRGNTVGTTLRPEQNLVKATDLTPEEKALARANIGAAAEGSGGGSEAYVLIGEPDGSVSNFDETKANAAAESGTLYFTAPVYGYFLIPCVEWGAGRFLFKGFVDLMGTDKMAKVSVYQIIGQGVWEHTPVAFAKAEDLGDIASALDHIIALQEALIGGGGK